MLKTISAALLAATMIAAPALAASTNNTTQAPATKTTTDKAAIAKTSAKTGVKTGVKTSAKAATKATAKSKLNATANTTTGQAAAVKPAKPSVLNANAKMHSKHYRHHRHHKPVSATKSNSKVSLKHVAQAKPANFTLNKAFRDQAKATFEVAAQSGRTPYFQFDGPPGPGGAVVSGQGLLPC